MDSFIRTEHLLGSDNMEKIRNSYIAIFGIGGVGGYVVEALARCGINHIDLIDHDVVSITNINRQIIATLDTIGLKKVDVMKKRILSINKDAIVNTYDIFFLSENANQFDFSQYDYVIDAIDTVSAKIELVLACKQAGTPIISSMGTGNKLNPSMLEVSDISKTSVCPLARVMRRELKKRNIHHLKVIYSKEEPVKVYEEGAKRGIPCSNSFVPASAGLLIASEVIKDLCRM